MPEIWPALPEMVLAVAAMALLLLGAWLGETSTRLVSWLAIGALILVLLITSLGGGEQRSGHARAVGRIRTRPQGRPEVSLLIGTGQELVERRQAS